MRGYSSVGRALPLQGRCQRFKSAYLHQFHMSPLFFLLFFVRDVVSSCFFETTGNNSKKVGVFLNVKPPSVFGNGLCKMRNFQVDGNRTIEGAVLLSKNFVFGKQTFFTQSKVCAFWYQIFHFFHIVFGMAKDFGG